MNDQSQVERLNLTILQYLNQFLNYANQLWFNKKIFGNKMLMSNYFSIIKNYPTYYEKIYMPLSDILTAETSRQQQQARTTLILVVILMEVICFCAILIIFPIQYKIQQQRERIYQLYSTIPRDKLEKHSQQYLNLAKYHSLSPNKSLKSTVRIFQEESVQKKGPNSGKKKAISFIDNLEKVTYLHVVIGLISFCILSIYPISNYFITNKYYKDLEENGNPKYPLLQLIFVFFFSSTFLGG